MRQHRHIELGLQAHHGNKATWGCTGALSSPGLPSAAGPRARRAGLRDALARRTQCMTKGLSHPGGVSPAGGFFASGFKRAFHMKDFGDTIPGHGGVTDRFDCQVRKRARATPRSKDMPYVTLVAHRSLFQRCIRQTDRTYPCTGPDSLVLSVHLCPYKLLAKSPPFACLRCA